MPQATIVAATMLMQLFIIVILTGAAAILSAGNAWESGRPMSPIILLLAVVTIGLLILSQPFGEMWAPAIGLEYLPLLSWSFVIASVFVLNAVALWRLVSFTGDATLNAFTPIYFVMPAMAIFLQEPGFRLLVYLVIVLTFFVHNLVTCLKFEAAKSYGVRKRHTVAFGFVSIACLLLVTGIGHMTRPAF